MFGIKIVNEWDESFISRCDLTRGSVGIVRISGASGNERGVIQLIPGSCGDQTDLRRRVSFAASRGTHFNYVRARFLLPFDSQMAA